jgi:glycolate oxidase FAD binding subunit
VSDVLRPDNFDQLQDLLQSTELVLPVGRRTKPSLSTGTGATLVSLAELTGITQYEPSEFTFTARAGTPIAEVAATLARKNQYLPFDPLLVNAGATVGGTVAAGLSGPGRARYGGLRDFLLGVRFLSGDGNVIHAGGKVVKNAAGFDIPKLLVGSLGRLGVMTELTFKVFPQAQSLHTYQLTCDDHQQAMARIVAAASAKWELDAIDYQPSRRRLLLRIAGAESTNQQIAGKIRSEWSCDLQRLDDADAKTLWTSIGELSWWDGAARGDGDRGSGFDSGTSGGDPIVVKVPVTPKQFLQLAANRLCRTAWTGT